MRVFIPAVRSAVLVLICLAMSPVFAQDPGYAGQDEDPPGRVARLSLTQGSVSLQPAGVQDWAAANVNRPLTTGDKLWTDQDSRAELDIGAAAIRMGNTTGFSFLNLDDHTAQMQVSAGTVIVRVRSVSQGDNFEVDTPNLAVSLLQPGQYRVEVNEAGDTTVVEVAEGDAQAAGEGAGYPIHAQQKATFTGTQQLSAVIGTLGAPDELDDWSLSRDRQIQSARSQQYVSTDATGYADLDDSGEWQDTPDYGYVWTPTTVAVGWAPYRFGHWVWIGPWGWTWIDDAPWGFAPFHYGRWVTYRDRWCWVPGPRHLRPVYAPALVAWVGGPAVGVSVTVGSVGWFPLGPREVYVPSYRVSPRYVERVNLTNTVIVNRTYITNVYENRVTNITYVNRNARGGVTTVSQSVFTSAQPVDRNWIRDERRVRDLPVRGTAPAIVPVRQSLVGANARVSVRQPPAAIMGRQVVARTAPPHAPVPFERQTEAIRANGGRPLGRAELARLAPRTPVAPVRVVEPSRNGSRSPPPADQPSMAERERAIRDGRQFGTAEGQRPPVAPREGRTERPLPAQGSLTTAPPASAQPRNNEPPPRNEGQPRFDRPAPQPGVQSRSLPQPRQEAPQQQRSSPPARNELQQRTEEVPRNQFQRNEPAQRFEQPPAAPVRPQVNAPPPQARPQFNAPSPQARPQFNAPPQINRPVERPVVRAPEPAPQVRQAPPPMQRPEVREAPRPPPQAAPRPQPQAAPRPQAPERREVAPGRQPPAKSPER